VIRKKDAAHTKGKIERIQPSTNFYATNFELGSISPLFIHPAPHSSTALH